MKKILVSLVVLSFLSCPAILAAAQSPDAQSWLNVSVQAAEDNTNVQVHLPLSMILKVMESVKVEGFDAGKVSLEAADAEIDWPALLSAVKEGPVGKYVTVTSDEANVDVSKTEKHLLINVHQKTDEKAEVAVRLPVELLDSIVVDAENKLDIAKVLRSLKTLPNGDIVTVKSDEANVRVWVE